MQKTVIGLALFLLLCYPAAGRAEEEPSKQRTVKLTLQEAILHALSNNIDIKIERLLPQIAQTDIEAEESVFDPAVTTEISKQVARQQSEFAVFLTGSPEPFQNNIDINAGLEKKTQDRCQGRASV